MRKLIVILGLLFPSLAFPALALGQTGNTFYVKSFPGQTVGQKATNAQAACNANTAVPCIIIFDPTLATYAQGTMPTECSQCIWQDYRSPGAWGVAGVQSDGNNGIKVQGAVTAETSTAKSPTLNVEYPDFGVGQPIKAITVTNGACTSAPSITISAPVYAADASQATATGYCVNGQTQVIVSFPGGGYSSTATATVTGGGTSGATATVQLVGTANVADPTGANDSSAPILNAIDYSLAQGKATGVTPQVYLPQGTFKLLEPIRLPCGVPFKGDGQNASILEPENNTANGITIYQLQEQPDPWDCVGSISNMAVYTPNGHNYQATEIEYQSGSGYSIDNLRVAGGGGRGLALLGPERTEASNIEIDTVRWPLIWYGNENHLRKLNIASPGEAGDAYCYGTGNCVNGIYPSDSWNGGTLESANGNGTTASFYIHGNSPLISTSPLVVGHWFNVAGTTGTVLDGLYQVTSVTNNVTSDPSGNCTSGNPCFEVQAASAVSGTATVGSTTTTATFSSGSYTITVASATGFAPYAPVTGTGIPPNTVVVSVSGTTVTLNNSTTVSEAGSNVTASSTWKPAILPDRNAAVTMSGANTVIEDGSIKVLWYAGAFDVEGVFGSAIRSFYTEGYPVNGQPHEDSSLVEENLPPQTTLASSLTGTETGQVNVAGTLWFTNYVNDPNDVPQVGYSSGYVLAPQDYAYGSTSPSAYVAGVEQGQVEVITAEFASDGMHIGARNQSGSTAPAGTAWPSGSLVVAPALGSNYGSMQVSNNHFEAIDGPGPNWASYCVDNTANVCSEILGGTIPNEITSFTTGQKGGSAGIEANLTLIDNEVWEGATEVQGEGYIKARGRGGIFTVLNGVVLTNQNANDYGATNGQFGSDYFINVEEADGSYPWSQYHNLDDGTTFNQTATNAGYTKHLSMSSDLVTSTGGLGFQFYSAYCFLDTPTTVGGHALNRWCFTGAPGTTGSSADFEHDSWNGTAWVKEYSENAAGLITFNQTEMAGGNKYSRHTEVTGSLSPASVAANTCAAQTLTVTGLVAGDIVLNQGSAKPTATTGLMVGGVRVTGANTVAINYCNVTAAAITPPTETYTFDVEQ